MRIKLNFLALICLFSPILMAKDVYIWVDEHGDRHFTDQKPKNVEAQVREYGKKPTEKVEENVIVNLEPRTLNNMRRTFSEHKDDLFSIYHQALEYDALLQGRVRFQLTIAANGDVTDSQILMSDFDSRALNSALKEAVLGFDFGVKNVQVTTTTWLMAFTPK